MGRELEERVFYTRPPDGHHAPGKAFPYLGNAEEPLLGNDLPSPNNPDNFIIISLAGDYWDNCVKPLLHERLIFNKPLFSMSHCPVRHQKLSWECFAKPRWLCLLTSAIPKLLQVWDPFLEDGISNVQSGTLTFQTTYFTRKHNMFLVVSVLFPPPGMHAICKSHRSEVLSNIRDGSPHPRGAVLNGENKGATPRK